MNIHYIVVLYGSSKMGLSLMICENGIGRF